MFESRCGVNCSDCERKTQVKCKGCTEMKMPFWGGICGVKKCSEGRGLDHCGQCPDFPCGMLATMGVAEGFDPEPKIRRCRKWHLEETVTIRELIDDRDIAAAIKLAWCVFKQIEAPDYPEEGIQTFRQSLEDDTYLRRLRVYGAFENGALIGMLATRNGGSHIALFFLLGDARNRGIGRLLFERAKADNPERVMTVNAAPEAVDVYHALGFADTDSEQESDGLLYTPMATRE